MWQHFCSLTLVIFQPNYFLPQPYTYMLFTLILKVALSVCALLAWNARGILSNSFFLKGATCKWSLHIWSKSAFERKSEVAEAMCVTSPITILIFCVHLIENNVIHYKFQWEFDVNPPSNILVSALYESVMFSSVVCPVCLFLASQAAAAGAFI